MPIFTDRLSINAKLVTVTTAMTSEDTLIVYNNGATAVTNTLPPIAGLETGHVVGIGRGQTSTGAITITLGAGATGVQALAGTVGATTTISAHGARGIGCINWFILIGTVWYRAAS